MYIYVQKLFSYKDGTGLTKPQKKINKSKFGTGCISAGPVLRNCVQLVLLVKQLLRSCTQNEKMILYPSLPNNQSVCGLCYSGQEKSSVTRVGGLVIIHDFCYIKFPHVSHKSEFKHPIYFPSIPTYLRVRGYFRFIGASVRRSSGRRLGGRLLAMT